MTWIQRVVVLSLLSVAVHRDCQSQQKFEVNLNDRTDDAFKVTLYPEHLSDTNNVFHFAAAAPGTYQTMDIGRFVADFRAFDQSGKEISTTHSSTNEWTLSRPADVRKITYAVSDIWDSKVEDTRIMAMCSSTISDDFVMINGHCVFGYFDGLQSSPIKIKIHYPSDWVVGTALRKGPDGYYAAEDFDKVVDSPFYLGRLSETQTHIGGAEIAVYTYSKKGLTNSAELLASIRSILEAESSFMKGLPVDRYVFLFHFGDFSAGAWEHNYSSEYVMEDDSLTGPIAAELRSIVAHEFFHINIPLHVHSELVERFNFAKPVMSQHLWLYEGTTEWAAHMLQLRDGLISLDDYLKELQKELIANDAYDQTVSLTDLGVHATEMQDQYPNIYQKGALVSTLLDLRLLQLSHGTLGLRELLMKLEKEYGVRRPFSEKDFFDKVVAMTFPEIRDFVDRYIRQSDKLPVQEYFNQVGIQYLERADVDSTKGSLGIQIGVIGNAFGILAVSPDSKSGLKKGDILEGIDTTRLTFQNIGGVFGRLSQLKPGNTIKFTIRRQNEEIDITAELGPKITRHKFVVNANASREQMKLREAWMKNM